MTDALVHNIVEQVLAALRARGVSPGPAGAPPAAGPRRAVAQAAGDTAAPKVFLTAELLERRLAAEPGDGRAVELAHNEFLTPAAKDVADERHLTVRRAPLALPKPLAASRNPAAPEGLAKPQAATMTLGLLIERPSETVRSVLAGLGHEAFSVVDYTQTDCWIANTRRLCEAILAGEVCRGAAILPYAADAMVLANKVRGIRAVQGSRLDSVAAAVRHFAPNLLVLEHTRSTFHEMRAMVRAFAAPRPGEPQAEVLMQTIAELERA